MRLISYLEDGTERLGIDLGGRAVAATDLLPDGPLTMNDVLADPGALDRLRHALTTSLMGPQASLPLESLNLLSPRVAARRHRNRCSSPSSPPR